ncbi:MAG: branched-chain amino acid aminotransferase [Flavisolibacter sp.]
MLATTDIPLIKAERSKLPGLSLENIPFGKYFTDHMLEADFENGEWKNLRIRPYQPLLLSPALAALHYGQAIFEGIMAYKDPEGQPRIFRPADNFRRFNLSAERMQMPPVPEEIFMEGIKQLVALDKDWIPDLPDHSLYIRPFMFSSDEMIGVRPSEQYKFMILLSPTGPYYSQPMRIYVEEHFVRAVPGGIGYVKAAGNYGSSMFATAEARKKGYDQVLWTDALEHKYVQEIGTMNVVFLMGNKAITPDLEGGTILAGVTRDSVLTLLREAGFAVEERPLGIDEILEAYRAGELTEVFGTGTAATITYIKELRYKDFVMTFPVDQWKTAPGIKNRLTAIREGRTEDTFGWMVKAN